MQAMQLQAGRSAAEQAEAFARQLHGEWGVGRAGCDDGVLLLLSVRDRQVRGRQGLDDVSQVLGVQRSGSDSRSAFGLGQRRGCSPSGSS